MRDPRIDEIIKRIGESDSKGKPTRVAEMARQVNDFLLEIEKLRSEVEIATRQVVYLTGREKIDYEEYNYPGVALIGEVVWSGHLNRADDVTLS